MHSHYSSLVTVNVNRQDGQIRSGQNKSDLSTEACSVIVGLVDCFLHRLLSIYVVFYFLTL